ncbi:hypothetical protein PBI_LAMBO_46 [Gordonia phage Lambo]|uniref:Uncharacterized protein n=4 Tax=Lambovirus TaxID=2843412 RepID=A0A5J6TRU6_9CAUD|nr:hypothetical protein HWC69_gp048 [Gordonia phage Ranch]YP_009852599.1 hypothetical protein HWC70_gp46 [Gordonia phage Lambo]YP_009852698.1 hypothetical protein HWC71_gp47 [Gordonia phage Sadboi]QFG08185.1 hypothetical protein PBI_GRETELLYN_46 [Gordonia phage GretelLyn]QFG12357.1 hypothetical protein PBI_RANCH_48 [Gordonia phage Ranch]QFG13555.1 hypothetical protein PBI_LAMBO_46 [Gordonia phage Lambo]QFG14697.1 hypothetical protein PBI_SADBOI_47 [Gordonia phage Sadboi]
MIEMNALDEHVEASVKFVRFLNREFSTLNAEEESTAAVDLANTIRHRLSKHNQFLSRNLQLRDVTICLLMMGLDMPVIDLLSKQTLEYLRKL